MRRSSRRCSRPTAQRQPSNKSDSLIPVVALGLMTSWLYIVTPSFARPCALSKICSVILVTLMVTLEGVEGVEDTSLGCRGCGLGVGSGGGRVKFVALLFLLV